MLSPFICGLPNKSVESIGWSRKMKEFILSYTSIVNTFYVCHSANTQDCEQYGLCHLVIMCVVRIINWRSVIPRIICGRQFHFRAGFHVNDCRHLPNMQWTRIIHMHLVCSRRRRQHCAAAKALLALEPFFPPLHRKTSATKSKQVTFTCDLLFIFKQLFIHRLHVY